MKTRPLFGRLLGNVNGVLFVRCLVRAFCAMTYLTSPLRAQTVTKYFVFKAIEYHQTSSSTPGVYTSDPTGPYGFDVGVNGTSLSLLSSAPSFTGPASGTLTFTLGRWDSTGGFASQAALDAALPNGTYNLTIPGFHSNAPIALNLTGDAYPSTIPQVTNLTSS